MVLGWGVACSETIEDALMNSGESKPLPGRQRKERLSKEVTITFQGPEDGWSLMKKHRHKNSELEKNQGEKVCIETNYEMGIESNLGRPQQATRKALPSENKTSGLHWKNNLVALGGQIRKRGTGPGRRE